MAERTDRHQLKLIRAALADYMQAEGCSCCRDESAHSEAATRLGQLLGVPRYKDRSGYDFGRFRSKPQKLRPSPEDSR